MRITNDGPDNLNNKKVKASVSGCGPAHEYSLTLAPGETRTMDTYCTPATGQKSYTVTVQAVDFTDPNGGNNSYTETLDAGSTSPPVPPGGGTWQVDILTADLALTDIFPSSLPKGDLYVRVTNNGPDKVQQIDVEISCGQRIHPHGQILASQGFSGSGTVLIDLDPGQTKEYRTKLVVDDTTKFWYENTCEIHPKFNDPRSDNNKYSETIAP